MPDENLPSAEELVQNLLDELKDFGNVLSPQDRDLLKEFAEMALRHSDAIVNAAALQPMELFLLSVLLEEQKLRARQFAALRLRIDQLKAQQRRPPQ